MNIINGTLSPCEICYPAVNPICTNECQEVCPLTSNYQEPKERVAMKDMLFSVLALLMDVDKDKFIDTISFGESDDSDFGNKDTDTEQMAVIFKMKRGWSEP